MRDGTQVYGVNDLYTHLSELIASGNSENGMAAVANAANLINNMQESAAVEELKFGKCSIILVVDERPDDPFEATNALSALKNSHVCSKTLHCFFLGNAYFTEYENLCRETGGYVLRDSNAPHVNSFIEFIKSGSNANGNSQSCHSFEVSLFVTHIRFLFLASGSSDLVITITSPSGAKEYLAVYGSYRVHDIDQPTRGEYRACISSGTMTMSVEEMTNLSLEMEYVEATKQGEFVPTCNIPLACKLEYYYVC